MKRKKINMSVVRIQKKTVEKILSCYTSSFPEQGGIIGMKNGVICEYIHDNSSQEKDRAIYVPNTAFLNNCITKWSDDGIEFCGMVHSHPAGQKELSSGDLDYIKKVYQFNPQLGVMFFPLIVGDHDLIVYMISTEEGQVVIRKDIAEIID